MLTTFCHCAFLLWYANYLSLLCCLICFSHFLFLFSFSVPFSLAFSPFPFVSVSLSFFLPAVFPSFLLSFFPCSFPSFQFPFSFPGIPCYPSILLSLAAFFPCIPVFPFIWLSLAFSSFPSMFTLLAIIFAYIAFYGYSMQYYII